MSVVFLTFFYPPAKYPRSIQISRLVKYSQHAIRVICCDESPKDFTIADLAHGKPQAIFHVPRRGLYRWDPRWWANRLPIPDNYRDWARTAAEIALQRRIVSANDTLVSFGNPMSDHVSALKLKRAVGMKWIAHFSDPWVDNPYRRRLPMIDWANSRLERSVLSASDRLIFTSKETVDLVMRKYPASWRDKTVVLPHAFDPQMFGVVRPHEGGVLLRYVGDFYPPRTPAPLILALLQLHHTRPEVLAGVRIELIGHLRSDIDLSALRSGLPPGMLSVMPPVDYRVSLNMMQEADLLLVIDALSENSVFLPSKLIDYIGAGRPIFAISPPGTSVELVAKLGGHTAHPANIDDVANKLAIAIGEVRSNPSMRWGAPEVRDEYTAFRVAARFDALLDEVSP